jgi:cytochrome P450
MTEIVDVEKIDYFSDPATINDPYEFFGLMAEHRPVYQEPVHGAFLVTGYEEALTVLRDPATFSSANLVNGPDLNFSEPFEGDDITDFVEAHRHELPQNDQIVTFDPPKHTDNRALLMGLITPKRLKENEDFMWRLADRQLDVVLPLGTIEFNNDYAQPYTLLVIADLLGVPEEDHADLLSRMGVTGPGLGDPNAPSHGAAGHATLEVHYPYFIAKIEERRKNPANDVLTGMALATFPDGTVPEPIEVARIASNLFAAGKETTVRLLGAVLQRIADDADIQKTLREKRELIPKFIEETLRYEGPIKGEFRLAKKKAVLGGVDIPAGSVIFLSNGAANRDPRQFECPAKFDHERPNVRRHMAFGHGIHTCPGAPLARSEVRVTIERLFDRTSNIEISEEHHGPKGKRRWSYMPTYMFRGLTDLFLTFTPK